MCNPALLIAVGTTAMSMGQQERNRQGQLKAQKIATDRENERRLAQQSAERINEGVEAEMRAAEIEAASTKVREARSTARTAAGESGVAGTSVDILLDSYTKQGAALKLGLKRQGRISGLATNLRIKDQGIQSTQNLIRINQPVPSVDVGGAISAGLATYSSVNGAWKDFKASKTPVATPPPTPKG